MNLFNTNRCGDVIGRFGEGRYTIFHFHCRWSWVFLIIGLLLNIGLLVDVANSEIPPVLQGLHNPPLGCHMRLYTYRITQTDEKGRQRSNDHDYTMIMMIQIPISCRHEFFIKIFQDTNAGTTLMFGLAGVDAIHVKFLIGNSRIKNPIIRFVCMPDDRRPLLCYAIVIRWPIQRLSATNI